MLKIIESFSDIIYEYKVIKYVQEGGLYSLHLEIIFIDNSTLVIKEYRLENKERKYSYHWMNKKKSLIIRWDNAQHWKNLVTFPHHKHIKKTKNVHPSLEITLEQVLIFISKQFNKSL